jgi:hypothetical protein
LSPTPPGIEAKPAQAASLSYPGCYSVSGGKFHHVIVNFNKDGKVKDWSSNTTGAY